MTKAEDTLILLFIVVVRIPSAYELQRAYGQVCDRRLKSNHDDALNEVVVDRSLHRLAFDSGQAVL
jgi:hypothetical protein